jgi:hypothetical protein
LGIEVKDVVRKATERKLLWSEMGNPMAGTRLNDNGFLVFLDDLPEVDSTVRFTLIALSKHVSHLKVCRFNVLGGKRKGGPLRIDIPGTPADELLSRLKDGHGRESVYAQIQEATTISGKNVFKFYFAINFSCCGFLIR